VAQARADAPYAPLLKRHPVQARSAARVDAILDAVATLVARAGLNAVTMRAVAATAGVPTGTIYQFFADKRALIQALALRYVSATPDVVDEVAAGDPGSWDEALAAVIDGYARMLREAPAMRALWLAGAMDAATRRFAGAADDAITERLRALLSDLAGRPPDAATAADWRYIVTLVSVMLRTAFGQHARGDADLLERTERTATLYAADLLGVAAPAHR